MHMFVKKQFKLLYNTHDGIRLESNSLKQFQLVEVLDRFIQIFWSHPRTRVRNLIKLQTFVDRNFKCFNQVALSNMQYFKTISNHNCHSSSYVLVLLRGNAVKVFSDFQTIMNKHLKIALTFGTCSAFAQSSIQYYEFSAFHVRRYTENFF